MSDDEDDADSLMGEFLDAASLDASDEEEAEEEEAAEGDEEEDDCCSSRPSSRGSGAGSPTLAQPSPYSLHFSNYCCTDGEEISTFVIVNRSREGMADREITSAQYAINELSNSALNVSALHQYSVGCLLSHCNRQSTLILIMLNCNNMQVKYVHSLDITIDICT
jgi:hypothetical protein